MKLPDNWAATQAPQKKRATYESRCAYCDEDVHEGDVIEKWGDDWVHLECAEQLKQEVDK